MSLRELVVLGTASQVPTRHRNHNGYLFLFDGRGFLFDPGEGTQRQMIRAGVSVSQVHHLCITHFHGDHSLGFAGLVQRISLDAVPHEVQVCYPASGQVFYERLRHATSFRDVAKIAPCPISEPGVLWDGGELQLSTRRLDHTLEAWGYRVDERDSVRMLPEALAARGIAGPDVGRLQREGRIEVDGQVVELADVSEPRPGQSMAFVMDTRLCDAAFELAEGVDLLVCESTYLESEAAEAKKNGHLTARQAARIAHEAGARKLVLTHYSQRYERTRPFLDEAREIHEDCVTVRDGDRVAMPPRR